jgi:cytochrome oxidase Cu insertion factor (SCO1/SenC/PrrC family)
MQPYLIGVAAALVLATFFGYRQLVKTGILRYNKWDRRERGSLKVGAAAPDLPLTMYDGTPTSLSKLWQAKPVFLVFGSCT